MYFFFIYIFMFIMVYIYIFFFECIYTIIPVYTQKNNGSDGYIYETTLIIIIMIGSGSARISKPVKTGPHGYKARSYPTKYTLLLPEISFVPAAIAMLRESNTGCYYAITGVISVTLLLWIRLSPFFRAELRK